MGIKGLWKEVQPVCRAGHISQFKGLRVGVDTYCWLHRAVIACSVELAMGRPCDRYLSFMMSRVDLLLRYGVTPVLIFDGDSMPMKRATDGSRQAKRAQALAEGQALYEQGALEEATRMFEKSLEVTTEIAYTVIQIMRDRGIECIVAPFEADAQLAYLAKEGYVSAVISEDSDLIVYHCGTLLSKMDNTGNCECLNVRDLPNLPSLCTMSYESFVVACILSGCDYLSSLPSVGIKTALKLAMSSKSIPLLMHALSTQYGFSSQKLEAYEEGLHKAFYCFAHHLVYDPMRQKVVPFRPLPLGVALQKDLIGELWSDDVAVGVCKDLALDPIDKTPYKHSHRSNVELYWKRTRRGQTSLTSFSAFEGMKSARVLATESASNSFGRILPETAVGLIGSRPLPLQPSKSTNVVVSKYFSKQKRLASFQDTSSSSSDEDKEDFHDAEDLGVATSRSVTGDDSGIDFVGVAPSPAHNAVHEDMTLPSPSSTPSCSQQSALSNTGSTPLMRSLPTTLRCPYGFPQCGKPHSIFIKCFQGKNWHKGDGGGGEEVSATAQHVTLSTPPMMSIPDPAAAARKRERDTEAEDPSGPSKHHPDTGYRRVLQGAASTTTSRPTTPATRIVPTVEQLRTILGAPSTNSEQPPVTQHETPPLHTHHGAVEAVPPVPVPARRMNVGLSLPSAGRTAPMSQPSASTKAAAALFEQLAYKRK